MQDIRFREPLPPPSGYRGRLWVHVKEDTIESHAVSSTALVGEQLGEHQGAGLAFRRTCGMRFTCICGTRSGIENRRGTEHWDMTKTDEILEVVVGHRRDVCYSSTARE